MLKNLSALMIAMSLAIPMSLQADELDDESMAFGDDAEMMKDDAAMNEAAKPAKTENAEQKKVVKKKAAKKKVVTKKPMKKGPKVSKKPKAKKMKKLDEES